MFRTSVQLDRNKWTRKNDDLFKKMIKMAQLRANKERILCSHVGKLKKMIETTERIKHGNSELMGKMRRMAQLRAKKERQLMKHITELKQMLGKAEKEAAEQERVIRELEVDLDTIKDKYGQNCANDNIKGKCMSVRSNVEDQIKII